MRIERDSLAALRTGGASAAAHWMAGSAADALAVIDHATGDPGLESPGTGVIAPQAATHIGHAIGEELAAGDALAFAACLLASIDPAHRMIGPHVLTSIARAGAANAGEILQLADMCGDSATAAALAIPLAVVLSGDPSAAMTALADTPASPPRRLALISTAQALAGRDLSLARRVRELASGPTGAN